MYIIYIYIYVLCILYIYYIMYIIYTYIMFIYFYHIYTILYIYPGLYYFGFIPDVFLVIEFWFMFISPASRRFWPRIRWKLELPVGGPIFHLNFREYPNIYFWFRILLTLQKVTKTSVVKSHKISAKCW